jgi:hypothetical protein
MPSPTEAGEATTMPWAPRENLVSPSRLDIKRA